MRSKEREKESRPHLSDTHVELDADDEEVSLVLAGGHQQLVGVTHSVDLLPNHRDCLAS